MKKPSYYITILVITLLISACDGESRPFSEAVEIRALNVQSITVLPPQNASQPLFLNRNERLQLSLQGVNGAGNTLTLERSNRDWQVDNPTVATISSDGLLTALEDGVVNVFVNVGGIRSSDLSVTVSNASLIAIESISGPTELRACVPGQYFARGLFSDDTQRTLRDVTFRIQDQSAENISVRNATSELATVTGFVPGDYNLVAEKDSVNSNPFAITVPNTLASINVTPATGTINVGNTLDLSAQGTYTSVEDESSSTTAFITESVLWQVQTSNNTVSVSNQSGDSGRVSGLAAGNASISARCGAVESTLSTITVTASSSSDLVFNVSDTFLNLVTTDDPFELRVATGTSYRSDNDISDDVEWSIDLPTGVSLSPISVVSDGDNAGNVTPLRAGTAAVQARRNSDNTEITITVVVRDP